MSKEIIYDIIRKDKRHPNYEYICERTKAWRAIVSGKGLDEYMQQFNQRETDEMFAQRKRLTKQITTAVCKNVRDIEYKVPRSNSIQRAVSITDKTKQTPFQAALDGFWGDSSLNDYMDLRWVELNDTDPNSFIVIEWGEFDENEYAQPYPYEVKSEEAIVYEYDNNVLQYLVSMEVEEEGLLEFTGYFQNYTIKVEQLPEEESDKLSWEDDEERQVLIGEETVNVVKLEGNYYEVYEPIPHNLGYVPAYQPGYVRDLATDGHSFLPPWWAAESVLMNLVKSKSELDLTIALHVFPQKFEYSPRCNNTGCNGGLLPDGATCSICKGTGFITHTTAQDTIRIALPKHPDEMIDLQQLVNYVYPPVDLVTFMDGYVDKLSQRAMQFVFNSEIYSRESVAETATGKEIDMQAVYDTLYPMAKAMSRDWEFTVETVADVMDIEATASFTFSKDFKLKSIDGYYADLISAGSASPFIKANIEDDIARITYADNPEGYAKYVTQKAFFPFTGDTPEQITLKMSQNYVPKLQKMLFSNYGWIFDELERENIGFYQLARQKQWDLIKAKLESIMPEEPRPLFAPAETTPIEEETEGEE